MGINEKEDTTMKFMTNIKTLAALLMAGAAFTACSSSDEIIEQPANPTAPKVYTMVIKASKGGDANTRALELTGEGNKTLSAYWIGGEDGEKIDVGQNGVKIGTATAATSDDGETTITATLTSAPTTSNDIEFYLCGGKFDYTGQVGLLTGTEGNSISEKYDYAWGVLYSGNFTVSGYEIIPGGENPNIDFYNGKNNVGQAVVKFTLVDKGNSDAPINATSLTIHDSEGSLIQSYNKIIWEVPTYGDVTISPAGTTNVIYAALSSDNPMNLTLTASDGTDTYTYTKSNVTFNRGQYYEITVKMTKQVAVGHALSSAAVGEVVGSDGLAYAGASYNNLPTGVTAVAKVCYVDGNGHGLALALVDMSTSLTWDNSGSNNDGKTAAEWCSAWNTSTPVTDAEWLLASKDQWNYMLGTSGAGSYTALRDGFTSVGGSDLKSNQYWSSTENEDDPSTAWTINFGNGSWGRRSKIGKPLVRACLAFSAAPAARALSEATTDDIGKIAGADGYIYDNAAAAVAAGSTAAAMIGYVGSGTGFTHGLAIALTEEGTWARETAISTAAAHTPTVSGGTWRLLTDLDIQYILKGCGCCNDNPSHFTEDGEYFSWTFELSNLQNKLNAVGGTTFGTGSSNKYWVDYMASGNYSYFYLSTNGYSYSIDDSSKTYRARAVLAF